MKKVWAKIVDSWYSLSFRLYWFDWVKLAKRVLLVGLIAGFLALTYRGYDRTYNIGFDRGRATGQCEVVCATFSVEFGFITDELDCWCELVDGNFWHIPLSKKFKKKLDK